MVAQMAPVERPPQTAQFMKAVIEMVVLTALEL